MPLWEYQQEILSIARHQNTLLSGAKGVGKTFLACHLIREQVLVLEQSHPSTFQGQPALSSSPDLKQAQQQQQQQQVVVVLVPSVEDMQCFLNQCGRFCGQEIVTSHQVQATSTGGSRDPASSQVDVTSQWENNPVFVQQKLFGATTSDGHVQGLKRILVFLPRVFQLVLRKKWIAWHQIALLVLEEPEQIHNSLPSFFPFLCQLMEENTSGRRSDASPDDSPVPNGNGNDNGSLDDDRRGGASGLQVATRGTNGTSVPMTPRLFVTTRVPISKLHLLSTTNPLYSHLRVINFVPVLSSLNMTSKNLLAPIFVEPFENRGIFNDDNLSANIVLLRTSPSSDAADSVNSPSKDSSLSSLTSSSQRSNPSSIQFDNTSDPSERNAPAMQNEKLDVRSFLLGGNAKGIDLVKCLRVELELGNSAANYDESKRQDKINRFMNEADQVYEHLGAWCLLKFVELELQTNLRACYINDPENINNRKKRMLNSKQENRQVVDENQEPDEEQDGSSSPMDIDELQQVPNAVEYFMEKLDAVSDECVKQKIRGIIKVLKWLNSVENKIGVEAASCRLLKVAQLVRSRFINEPAIGVKDSSSQQDLLRVWVALERRCHCRVVAEYLTACLKDLGLPNCCCMLGNSHARISGSVNFSSYLKVMTHFVEGKARVLVTTSISENCSSLVSSWKSKVNIPLVDLVVIMDQFQEPNKLYNFVRKASIAKGIVKYVLPKDPGEYRKYEVLIKKMDEFIQTEKEQEALLHSLQGSASEHSQLGSATEANDGEQNPMEIVSKELSKSVTNNQDSMATHAIKKVNDNSINREAFEMVNEKSGARLNLSTSVTILSEFCDTLPGLDTYDRRPQYAVKRHPLPGVWGPSGSINAISKSKKLYKKKRQRYNQRLEDNIDALVEANTKAEEKNSERLQEGDESVQDEGDDGEIEQDGENEGDLDNVQAGEKDDSSDQGHYLFSASLRLPMMLRIRKEYTSPKVPTERDAKGIVAFKACQELVKKDLLDDHFRSKLSESQTATIHKSIAPEQSAKSWKRQAQLMNASLKSRDEQLDDLSTQNSYDLPPVSARELSLRTIRSLFNDDCYKETGKVTLYFYGLQDLHFAILCSNELWTGMTNVSWRHHFATSEVMEPKIHPVTLQKKPTMIQFTKEDLAKALHFHLVTMRLVCMGGVADALREIKLDQVWKEFSEQNDKGYLVIPSIVDPENSGQRIIDWEYLNHFVSNPLLKPIGTSALEIPMTEWVCVPNRRTNVTYVVKSLWPKKVSEVCKPLIDDEANYKQYLGKVKSTPGNPILGRWYSIQDMKDATQDQYLLHVFQVPTIVPLIRRVMQRNLDEGSIAQSSVKFNERLMITDHTNLLNMTKTRYFEAMGMLALLYEFERKCQMSNLMRKIGMELDLVVLDDATTKPAYERLEILGDTFLKLETSWFLFHTRQDITEEGQLTRLRRDIIRNDRLVLFARQRELHRYMLYPAEIEQHPFRCWKPSCMGMTPEPLSAPSKWIADIVESVCGAYLIGRGEVEARRFLRYMGVDVLPDDDSTSFAKPYYPHVVPNEQRSYDSFLYPLEVGFEVIEIPDLADRLYVLQKRMNYSFRDKTLLLQAVVHPSVRNLTLRDAATNESSKWSGNYERLEYLGDAIIEYLSLSFGFVQYAKWLPGALTQWKSSTVSNDALGKTAIACFGIDEVICAGRVRMDADTVELVQSIGRRYVQHLENPSRSNLLCHPFSRPSGSSGGASTGQSHSLPKMFGDVFEALVAAVFLDSGHDLNEVRDVFLGPLLSTIGRDALAYVCRENGLDTTGMERHYMGMDMEDGQSETFVFMSDSEDDHDEEEDDDNDDSQLSAED